MKSQKVGSHSLIIIFIYFFLCICYITFPRNVNFYLPSCFSPCHLAIEKSIISWKLGHYWRKKRCNYQTRDHWILESDDGKAKGKPYALKVCNFPNSPFPLCFPRQARHIVVEDPIHISQSYKNLVVINFLFVVNACVVRTFWTLWTSISHNM